MEQERFESPETERLLKTMDKAGVRRDDPDMNMMINNLIRKLAEDGNHKLPSVYFAVD